MATQRQSQKSSTTTTAELPRSGDKYHCQQCGMEVEITKNCECEHGAPRLECCGQPLTKD